MNKHVENIVAAGGFAPGSITENEFNGADWTNPTTGEWIRIAMVHDTVTVYGFTRSGILRWAATFGDDVPRALVARFLADAVRDIDA